MKTIEVCLTPDLLEYEDAEGKLVVVIDILRATSCMVTALASGVKSIIPVSSLEDAQSLQAQGYLVGAERGGKQVEGFELDNSPFSYMKPELQGKTIGLTTSNGTFAIKEAQRRGANEVIVGAFLNKSRISQYIRQSQQNTMLVCAGWKGKVNLEDAFYAGSLLNDVIKDVQFANDSCILARSIYHIGQNNYKRFLKDSSHFQRLMGFGNEIDIDFCLTENRYQILPKMQGNELVAWG
ncbi:MAG: 2-phosphosulfolactate phosphatase [Microscillaceae bacterium]|jgi:2-phosphosulfolactate phosphatase|nr:2-phosphosulfolactate phosphatase [Microscillaceae bacterium]